VYPLLIAVGRTQDTATREALQNKLRELQGHLAAIYAAHAKRYREEESARTTIKTPDQGLDASFGWAETAIEQLRATAQPSGETGLVAGYFSSRDTARPGFGWFFGRDALYTIYALNSYGNFKLTRDELEFLMTASARTARSCMSILRWPRMSTGSLCRTNTPPPMLHPCF
jgi:glycogen debranching enzyme